MAEAATMEAPATPPPAEGNPEALRAILGTLNANETPAPEPVPDQFAQDDDPVPQETKAEEPEKPTTEPAQNPFEGLEQDEIQVFMEDFKSFLESRGEKMEAAPVQPTATPAADPPPQQHQQYAYEPFTQDDLLDPDSYNEKAQMRDAYIAHHAKQAAFNELLPMLGQIVEVGLASILIERDNPDLRGQSDKIALWAKRERDKNPTASPNEIVENVAKTYMKSSKALSVVQKLLNRGETVDASKAVPPPASPAGNAPRNPVNGQFTSNDRSVSPIAALIYRQGVASGQIKPKQ